MSNPTIITDHFNKIRVLREKYSILPGNTYNVDEKGFRQGISDRTKVIVRWRERGMTAKVATDGKWELTVRDRNTTVNKWIKLRDSGTYRLQRGAFYQCW